MADLHRPLKDVFFEWLVHRSFSLRPSQPPRRMSGAFSANFGLSKVARASVGGYRNLCCSSAGATGLYKGQAAYPMSPADATELRDMQKAPGNIKQVPARVSCNVQ
jgi:hypothetical protein